MAERLPSGKFSRAKPPELRRRAPGAGGARPGAGRPAYVPTDADRAKVEALAGYGLRQPEIASLINGGMDWKTLVIHFREELDRGVAKANAQVSKSLFDRATKDKDTTAMIWWTKSRMRWTERHEITGADGGAIKQEQLITMEPSEAYKRMLGVSSG